MNANAIVCWLTPSLVRIQNLQPLPFRLSHFGAKLLHVISQLVRSPRRHAGCFIAMHKLAGCARVERGFPIKIVVFIFAQQFSQPLETCLADKWLNRENGSHQFRSRITVKLCCPIIHIAEPIQLGLQFSDNGVEAVASVPPSPPPSQPEADASSNATANDSADCRACCNGWHFMCFWLCVLTVVASLLLWQW